MAQPEQRSGAAGQWTQYFINNAPNIPRLLQEVSACNKDLDSVLVQLEESISSLLPVDADSGFICREDARWKTIMDMFSAGILGSVVDIALSDRLYAPSQRLPTANLEVPRSSTSSTQFLHIKTLTRAIWVLVALLDLYSRSENDRARSGSRGHGLPTQNAEDEMIKLLHKLLETSP